MNLLALALVALAGGDVQPREATREELESSFPLAWRVPDELWTPKKDAESTALPLSVPALLAVRFEAPQPWMASVGDIIAEHRKRGGDHPALQALLAELERAAPKTFEKTGRLLQQLLDDRALRDAKWDPDEERRDDGMYFGPLLERHTGANEPWKSQEGSRKFHQAVTFVRGDLDSILTAIHDYQATIRNPGTSYEKLEPVAGSLVRCDDAELGALAALSVDARSDLPFPFGGYRLDLRILHAVEQGTLVTYVSSMSKDFYWFAGKDWYFPVRTSAGEWLGTMVVRMSGFDLTGVPDGDDDRKSGTRGALGSVRKRAEALFASSGGVPRTVEAEIPPFVATVPAARK